MGVRYSKNKPTAERKAELPDSRYKVVFEVNNEVISFDPSQSLALCVGIDVLAKDPDRSLGDLVKHDCVDLSDACSRNLGIPKSQVKTIIASEDPHELVNEVGLSTLIIDSARSVGPEGILFFAFSGHGITAVKNDREQAVLALVNHTEEAPDCLAGSDLSELILEKANFRGRNVILVLDCCFSGGISKWTECNDDGTSKFRSIAACSAYQTSIQLDPLEHSIFTYFLLNALQGNKGIVTTSQHEHPDQGEIVHLCLKDVFEHISDSSWALSSMYIRYDPVTQSLHGCTMTPEVSSVLRRSKSEENMLDAVEMTDGGPYQNPHGRFQIVQRYWKMFPAGTDTTSRAMPQNSYRWLKRQRIANGPLLMLKDRGHLKGKVLQAVLCALAHSVASIHLYEKHPWNGKVRLFIVDYTEIISFVEVVHGEEIEDGYQFSAVKEVLAYYYTVYRRVDFPDVSELRSLFRMLATDQIQHQHSSDTNTTDGKVSTHLYCNIVCGWLAILPISTRVAASIRDL